MELVCFSTARSETCNELAMAALLLPFAISPRISDSRGVSHERSDFRRDDLASMSSSTICGIDHGARLGDRADGLRQLVGSRYLLLQQVGPPRRPRLEKRQRVGGRLVLAEDHDARPRAGSPVSHDAAWIPSSVPVGGMRMSVTTTSGESSSMSSRSSGRSAARPTSSRSGSPSMIREMPSRKQRVVLRQYHPDGRHARDVR